MRPRRDLLVQQLTSALADSGCIEGGFATQLRAQQREIAEHEFADVLGGSGQIAPEAVRAFYDGNPARFQYPRK
jgi:hypothetical protein